MRGLLLALVLCFGSVSSALAQEEISNPEIKVIWPLEGGPYVGGFVVEVKNFGYVPELATNPVEQFAVGVDALGEPLRPGEGHLHGWVFPLDRFGRLVRDDAGRPTPASYVRFYGAGGAEYYPSAELRGGYYVRPDSLEGVPRGRYRAYFVLQASDHTGALQATAPAFPGISSVDFFWRGSRQR